MARLDAAVLRMEEDRKVFSQPPGAADKILQAHGRSAILEQNCTASSFARVDTFCKRESRMPARHAACNLPTFGEFKGLQ
jgi:hypothetical protein